jgi:hypothetical protein
MPSSPYGARGTFGSEPAETLFSAGNLARVFGLRLRDGRTVVVKVRPAEPRLAGLYRGTAALVAGRIPCPEPLAGPLPLATTGYAVNAESLIAHVARRIRPPRDPARAQAFAHLLARLIDLAPAPDEVPDLAPAAGLDQLGPSVSGSVAAARRPRRRPQPTPGHGMARRTGPRRTHATCRHPRVAPVIGHCDWESHNLEFRQGEPWAVHDWDSVVSAPETVIVGVAAAMWPAGADSVGASIEQSEEFLDAYQLARGQTFSPRRIEEAWAAGTWIRAFNGKKFLLDGLDSLSAAEAGERARRAGLDWRPRDGM